MITLLLFYSPLNHIESCQKTRMILNYILSIDKTFETLATHTVTGCQICTTDTDSALVNNK